jgi:hypothetical protein
MKRVFGYVSPRGRAELKLMPQRPSGNGRWLERLNHPDENTPAVGTSGGAGPRCLWPRCLTSPQAPRQPGGALIDATFAPDELVEGLGSRLAHACVPHRPRPLASGSLVGLGRVGGAPNNRGERGFPIRDFQPLQAQRSACSVEVSAFGGPPRYQAVERSGSNRSRCGLASAGGN